MSESAFCPERLLPYFAHFGRDLPWRHRDAGPWGVLVSEIMLQQTPVTRVLPVYREWMRRWPTPQRLAADSAGEAVRAWGRLGYPRRALRLHLAAQMICQQHGGQVPADLRSLLALPGVGEYTARAVLAFAFHRRVPVVDTNVRRVLSRAVRGIDEHRPATERDRTELDGLLPDEPAEAAAVSAAIMELGALHCTATNPACGLCPIAARCAWRAAGYPDGPPKPPAQTWHGTDRQVRGRIMAILRAAPGAVPADELLARAGQRHALVTAGSPAAGIQPAPSAAQLERCLQSLLADGLAVRDRVGSIRLP